MTKLSIVVSTYNRCERLVTSLPHLLTQIQMLNEQESIELLVVDNCSTDGTFEYLSLLAASNDLRVIRNSANQGMLGNLSVCALRASSNYVWCIGDDDHILPGALNRVLKVINDFPMVPLIYLNYVHKTLIDSEDESKFSISEIEYHLEESGIYNLAESITANSNLMTAIYTMVLRRDLAIATYSSKSLDAPFTSLSSCVPTTCLALSLSPDQPIYWEAIPAIAVDLRVSWMRYAPIWILERIPEMILRIRTWGRVGERLDFTLQQNIPGVRHWCKQTKEEYVFPKTVDFLRSAYAGQFSDRELAEIVDKVIESPR